MPDVMGYTLRQVSAFVAAINRSRRADRVDRLCDLRASTSNKKDFAGYIKELKK
ncbi:MAG TPA: hypothetical protein PKH39_15240 [Woeseiaceae bacterium]|nr:hypothetical protein [Woeseiaceae bacterium]